MSIKLNVLNETGFVLTYSNNGANSLRNAAETIDKMLKQAPERLRGELQAASAQLWALWDHLLGVNIALTKVHTELRAGRPAEA